MAANVPNPIALAYLELALFCVATFSSIIAYFLVRSTRRIVDPSKKIPAHLPSTPLTREPRQRVRTLSIV